MKKFFSIACVCSMCLLMSGCLFLAGTAAVGAAGAGIVYLEGKLTASLDGSLAQSKDATISAFKELKIAQKSILEKGNTITLNGTDSEGSSVQVNLITEIKTKTNVEIRFGTFGDKTKSSNLLLAIQKNL